MPADIKQSAESLTGQYLTGRRRIEVPEHIKTLGSYDVAIKYYGGVTATVKVWVVRA